MKFSHLLSAGLLTLGSLALVTPVYAAMPIFRQRKMQP